MRIMLLADTHGVLDPRVADLARGADVLVHAGDVGAGIADELAGLCDDVLIVTGNNDPDDAPWPESARRALPGGELVVIHGHQWPARSRHDRLRRAFPEARAIVCGHSHRRVLDTDTAPWILNPGAAGRSRAYGGPGGIELFVDGDDWQPVPRVFEPQPRRR